jgi:glycosyltransferase involved in cell wall biosynthesis
VPAIINTIQNIEDYFTLEAPKYRAVRWVERRTSALASAHACCADAVGVAAIRYIGVRSEQLVTIHNSIPDLSNESLLPFDRMAARRELGLPNESTVIGFIGRLHSQKQPSAIVASASDLRSQKDSLVFALVGDGPLRQHLHQEIERYGLGQTVRLCGFRQDAWRLLAAFDAFLLPSRTEGLPVAILEAMRAGVPVIATDVGGNAEAVLHEQSGLIVPFGDQAALTNAIRRLALDPELRISLGAEARRQYELRFTADAMVQRYLDLYARVLAA